MHRRDLLKSLPLSIAGISELARTAPAVWGTPALAPVEPLAAQVMLHNGTPTVFLNDKPVFAGMCWVVTSLANWWEETEKVRALADAGIHWYAIDAGKDYEWVELKAGRSDAFDFSTVEARYGRIIDIDPLARFHLRLHFEFQKDDWWMKAYPAEAEISSEGKAVTQSFASAVWRQQTNVFIRAFIDHLKRIGLLDRITAFQPGAGHTGEWVKGETAMSGLCGDYGEPMRRYFRSWLRGQYHDDLTELRAAWNNPKITFETAEVPTAEEQLQTRLYTFRDPARERNVIDYYRCFADLSGDLVIDFCRTVKEATDGKKLAGAFYGYLMELAWNGGFFAERLDSDYSTYQRGGHLGLRKVLESPYVDFLVCPYSYGFRGIGGDSPAMQPAESARLHGKLCIIEDDSRTHIDPWHDPNYGHVDSLAKSVAVLQRNFAQVITHGQGMWWMRDSIDPAQEPGFVPWLRTFQEIGDFVLRTDRTPSSEIAVLLDDESFFYETDRNNLDLPLIFQQRLWGLPRTGAPFDTYLLQDFIAGRMKPYKLYIFLNPLRLDATRRIGLNRELRRGGRVALWIYAPGYLDASPSLDHMQELTGFKFASGGQPWGPLVQIVDFSHPITKHLSQDVTWGTNNKLSPIFYLDDPDVRVLGQVVFSQGNCKPGMGVKTFREWTSIYVAAPNVPASVLRGIAGFAGVHLYSTEGDVLYATRDLLAVHTVSGGSRNFLLPQQVEVVYDLFQRRTVERNCNEFHVSLRPATSALFYKGGASLMNTLKHSELGP